LLNRVADICRFEGRTPQLTIQLVDIAWQNYFGTSHFFAPGQFAGMERAASTHA